MMDASHSGFVVSLQCSPPAMAYDNGGDARHDHRATQNGQRVIPHFYARCEGAGTGKIGMMCAT